jgi:tetratricopeptide (TPR) repeat protein
MSEGDVVRGVLTGVVEAITAANAVDDKVSAALMAYGRALDYEASWGLATDVFTTVSKLVKPERNPRLVVEANVAIGGAGRRNGDWEVSARAYSQAAFIADTLGDRRGVLTVQVGIANTYLAKGNLPQAQLILDDVLVQAQDQGLEEVQGVALHSRAALAARRGQYADGIKLAYDALRLTSTLSEKDQILADLGGMFSALGMREAARDTNLILIATAQAQFTRWSATLNLMELASLDGNETAFDSYARELAQAPLGVWVRSHYLLFLGEGFRRLGRNDAAVDALTEAITFAESNQLHEVGFKANAALETARATAQPTVAFIPPPTYVPDDVGTVVRAISDLRKATAVVA